MSVGAIDRGSESGVLSDQVLFRDPTGTGTEASHRYRDFIRDERLHQFGQWGDTYPCDLLGNVVFDQRSRLSHEMMPG